MTAKIHQRIAAIFAHADQNLWILLLLPWLLALNNEIWLFDLHGNTDPWFYFGFFLRFEQFLQAYGATYYATRLAQIIPGHLAFTIFPPIIAQYLLHIGFYYLAILSIYFLLKRTVGDRSALLAAVMMGCYGWFLTAIGSNYVDGFGIAYYAAAIYLLVLAAQESRWRTFLFLSGVFYGLAIFCNLFWIALAPPLILYYLIVNFQHRKNSIIHSSLLVAIGIVATMLVLASINLAITGRFLFFLPSVNAALYYLPIANPWKIGWAEWAPNGFWLPFLATTLISGMALWVVSRLKHIPRQQSLHLGFQICFLLGVLIFIALTIKGMLLFQFNFYASYLMPSAFIAIGAQLSQLELGLNRLKRYQFSLIVAGIVLCTLFVYRLPTEPSILQNRAILITLLAAVLWILFIGIAWLMRNQVKLISNMALCLLLLSFTGVNVASILMNPTSILIWTHLAGTTFPLPEPRSFFTSEVNRSQRRDAFLLTGDSQRYLATLDPKAKTMLWYDIEELLLYRSIAFSAIQWRPLNEDFPNTGWEKNPTQDEKKKVATVFEQNPNVVVLSQKPDAFELAQRSLQLLGFSTQLISTHKMQHGALSFKMTLIKVSPEKG